VALFQVAESYHSKLVEFKSKAENNEPIPLAVFEELKKLMNIGGSTILNEYRTVITQVWSFFYSNRSVIYDVP
jgi:hypothetical protein